MNMDEYDSMKPAECLEKVQRERDEARLSARVEVRIARAAQLVAEQALQQTDDALSACRADNAELQRERDESRVAHDVTKSQLIASRAATDRARADLAGMQEQLDGARADGMEAMHDLERTIEQLRASRELALVELDEKVNRIALLESDAREFARLARSHNEDCERVEADLHAELDEKVKRIAELERDKNEFEHGMNFWHKVWQKQAEAGEPPAGWRKTRDEMVADYTVHLSTEDLPGDTGTILEAVGFMLRWEPKT